MTETLYGILQVAIRKALNELSVPTPDYPAPVANAVEILNQALKDTEQEAYDIGEPRKSKLVSPPYKGIDGLMHNQLPDKP